MKHTVIVIIYLFILYALLPKDLSEANLSNKTIIYLICIVSVSFKSLSLENVFVVK